MTGSWLTPCYFIHYLCGKAVSARAHDMFCFRLWLNCSLQSGIRENVLQFPRIQMANCTRPPALNDKWQKSTFHPSPSLPLGCTLIFLLKVWWKAQLDVWMQAALERVWYRIILFNSYSAYRSYLCFWCSQTGVQVSKPTSWSHKMLSTKTGGFWNILIVGQWDALAAFLSSWCEIKSPQLSVVRKGLYYSFNS